MVTVKGILKTTDLGPGGWEIKSSNGTRYSLHGNIPKDLINKLVIVEGRPSMSMMMVGDALEVVTIRAVPPQSPHPQK